MYGTAVVRAYETRVRSLFAVRLGRRIAVQSATGSPPFVFFSMFSLSTPSLLLGAGRQASQSSQSLSTADYGLPW